MCLPDCQLGGSWGVGYTHTRRVTPCRKRCLEHRISQKGEYRCSCSEQFRGIVVLYLGMSLPSSVSTGSGNPKAFPGLRTRTPRVGAWAVPLLLSPHERCGGLAPIVAAAGARVMGTQLGSPGDALPKE